MLYYWQTKYTALNYITLFIFPHNRHFFVHIYSSVLEVWKFPCGRTPLRWMWQEDEGEDVRSYWMTLRTGEDTLIWKRRLWIALCGGIVLEEALDLSSDRLLNNNNNVINGTFRRATHFSERISVVKQRLTVLHFAAVRPWVKPGSFQIRSGNDI